MRFELH
nr:unnamed protein product [Callosobruchus chinensis]